MLLSVFLRKGLPAHTWVGFKLKIPLQLPEHFRVSMLSSEPPFPWALHVHLCVGAWVLETYTIIQLRIYGRKGFLEDFPVWGG